MARYLPKGSFVDGRGQDFAEPVLQVLGAKEGDELVNDVRAIWKEERRSGSIDGRSEELLGCSQSSVVVWR
jgi:hypothetical protein